jgi:mannitol/fructose-specific phosphotransferase system IIA component (Ntr-type)
VDKHSKPNSVEFSKMILRETVRCKVMVQSWEEATTCVGKLLLDARKILPGYINAMKQVLKELGPYVVIAPGIALLHARPEEGVIEPCMGLITLSHPVPFGHSQNDPVDIVIALAAINKDAHIASLQHLAEMLAKPEVLEAIRSAQNDLELFEVLNKSA